MQGHRHFTLPLAAGITIVTWASAYPGVRAGLEYFSPAHVAVLRILAASLALGVFAVYSRVQLPVRRDLGRVLLLGFTGFSLYSVALNTGQQTVQAGPAALIVQTSPIWTALLASFFLRERLRRWAWLGIAVSFAGVLLIAMRRGNSLEVNTGALLVLAAAISTSCYFVLQKRMLEHYRAVELTCYAVWAGGLWLLPLANGIIGAVQAAPPAATLAVLYLGIGPVAVGYVAWAVVLSRLPAFRAATLLYAVPVMAFVFGWIWLGEVPETGDLLGGALALGGVALVNTLGRARSR